MNLSLFILFFSWKNVAKYFFKNFVKSISWKNVNISFKKNSWFVKSILHSITRVEAYNQGLQESIWVWHLLQHHLRCRRFLQNCFADSPAKRLSQHCQNNLTLYVFIALLLKLCFFNKLINLIFHEQKTFAIQHLGPNHINQ